MESPAPASTGSRRTLVVSGGIAPDPALVGPLPQRAFVIAADSGLEHAAALGLRVDVLVGDLDSASSEAVRAAERAGVRIERHPVDKEATDLELALDHALAIGATRVTVVSGGGGPRLDHHLAELVLLASARYAPLRLDARIGAARAVPVHAGEAVALTGEAGAVLTLLALGGPRERHHHQRPALAAARRGARARLDARCEQRDRRGPRARRAHGRHAARGGLAPARARRTISRAGRRRRSRSGPGC